VHETPPKVALHAWNGGHTQDALGLNLAGLKVIDGAAILGPANRQKGILAQKDGKGSANGRGDVYYNINQWKKSTRESEGIDETIGPHYLSIYLFFKRTWIKFLLFGLIIHILIFVTSLQNLFGIKLGRSQPSTNRIRIFFNITKTVNLFRNSRIQEFQAPQELLLKWKDEREE
jgi:hypothetical protein